MTNEEKIKKTIDIFQGGYTAIPVPILKNILKNHSEIRKQNRNGAALPTISFDLIACRYTFGFQRYSYEIRNETFRILLDKSEVRIFCNLKKYFSSSSLFSRRHLRRWGRPVEYQVKKKDMLHMKCSRRLIYNDALLALLQLPSAMQVIILDAMINYNPRMNGIVIRPNKIAQDYGFSSKIIRKGLKQLETDNVIETESAENDGTRIYFKKNLFKDFGGNYDVSMETNDRISMETNDRISMETNDRISMETNDRISMETNDRISMETNDRISMETNDRISMETNDRISMETNDRISMETNDRIGMETNDRIGMETNDRIGMETNDRINNSSFNSLFNSSSNSYAYAREALSARAKRDDGTICKNTLRREERNFLNLVKRGENAETEILEGIQEAEKFGSMRGEKIKNIWMYLNSPGVVNSLLQRKSERERPQKTSDAIAENFWKEKEKFEEEERKKEEIQRTVENLRRENPKKYEQLRKKVIDNFKNNSKKNSEIENNKFEEATFDLFLNSNRLINWEIFQLLEMA